MKPSKLKLIRVVLLTFCSVVSTKRPTGGSGDGSGDGGLSDDEDAISDYGAYGYAPYDGGYRGDGY